MPRKARTSILYDGCFAHVFSRSIETRFIFEDAAEFDSFRTLLHQARERFGFQIFHYCLMHTHFHLAVRIGSLAGFSDGLKWVKWQFTQAYNRKRRRRGTVWQGRFQSLLIEDTRYLRACGQYIEENPVQAGLVKDATAWPYSSSRYYQCGTSDGLIDDYQWDGSLPEPPGDKESFFEKGVGIGAPLFQIHLKEDLSSALLVP